MVSLFIVLWLLALNLNPSPTSAQEVPELQINSTNYIVLDADTGEVYAQRGAHERAAMASLTKIFTAIEAIERGSPEMTITTRPSDLFGENHSLMGFGAGESYTLYDLLHGMMLPSGNDAAHAIARALGHQPGDSSEEATERFIGWMNQRIENMGLTDTHLINPHGWGVPGHYSTVYDLAAFTRYALQYPAFVDLISSRTYTTTNGYELFNNNRMFNFYPDLIGGKTGYDWDAGYCLIEVASRGGSTMISVTFDGLAPDDWYDDNRVLLDYAFEQKAKRVAAEQPIAGDLVMFLDPDAAILGRTATGGGSLPPPDASSALNSSDNEPSSSGQPGDSAGPSQGVSSLTSGGIESNGSRKIFAAVSIAMLLISARALTVLASRPLPRLAHGRVDQPNSPDG